MAGRKGERHHATPEDRERRARRAIGAGAGIVLAGFVIGCIVSFLPAAIGMQHDTPIGLEWVVVVGSLTVGFIGLVAIVFGLIELARSRPDRERPAT